VWVTSLVCGQGYRVVAVVALLLFRVGVGSPRKVKGVFLCFGGSELGCPVMLELLDGKVG